MHAILSRRCGPQSTTLGYLLAALNAVDIYDYIACPSLPADCIVISEREAVIAVTSSAPPLFRAGVARAARDLAADVVLLRLDAAMPKAMRITADVALGASSFKPWIESALELWSDGHSMWLVPEAFGPAISISHDGFKLEIVPPYCTLAERSAGIARAQVDLASLVHGVGAAA